MHQHPRSPAPAQPVPSLSGRPSSSRAESRRDQELGPSSRGLGLDAESPPEKPQNTQQAKDSLAKLNQIIVNYHTKAALIILHSRVELPPSFRGSDSPRVNRWFNVEIEETDVLRDQLRIWRTCDATDNRPPPLIIETYLDTKGLTNNQSLVILDENGKRWDVLDSLAASQKAQSGRAPSPKSDDVILERWKIELGDMPGKLPADLGSVLATVYKKSIIVFRTLFTYSKFLPAWKFAKRNGRVRRNPALRIKYRILSDYTPEEPMKPDHLTAPLYEGQSRVTDTYSFGTTDSPAGPFSAQVTYRTNCDFRVDDSEALLSSQFMGADDELFRPSLPSRESTLKPLAHEVGSAPLEKRMIENPDPSQAYGSLSTFHQVGPTTSTSPISALRAARESGTGSPSPPGSSPRTPIATAKAGPAGRAAVLAGEGGAGVPRRPSISFPAFKAPPLSASPSLVDPPLGASPRSVAGPRTESKNMPPPSSAATARRSLPSSADNAIASFNSPSSRPAPVASRYSSSFSNRRSRPQSSGTNKIEDDASSGRASATSSAQPGSGLFAEATGTSADSIHADDDHITDFLKMLETRKGLMNAPESAASDAPARRTTATAALNRFKHMQDSNAALSDSMSSSLLLHRSSNSSSKQLSGVPPMAAGTSISTASSPGKPISPHTPHTPAIPSRLSSNSIVDYNASGNTGPDMASGDQSSPLDDNNTSTQTPVNAIDIPTSPRVYPPAYRRSSSAAHRPRSVAVDEDDIFPFNLRSMSLGAEERSSSSLSNVHRPLDDESNTATAGRPHRDSRPSSVNEGSGARDIASRSVAPSSGSHHHVYQPRFGHSRGRGSSGGPHSLSSASSSLARGAMIPNYLSERGDNDRDGNGSGSNSGTSILEGRGGGRRASTGRSAPPQAPQLEEEEPMLFFMSDCGVSRRSLEEGRHGNHADGTGGTSGSRRGSGRRGGGGSAWPS